MAVGFQETEQNLKVFTPLQTGGILKTHGKLNDLQDLVSSVKVQLK